MSKNLLKSIEERMPTFSKSQKLISSYILENYDKAAYMTASKLGAEVHVSESTVVRYAIELAFEGYPEFQHALQEIVRTKLTSFQRMEVTNNLIGDGDVLTKVLLSDIEGLYTADPRKDPTATLISHVPELTDEILALAGVSGSDQGTGGMITKLQAAKICLKCGCTMVIASGSDPENLYGILEGKGKGTLFGEVRS